MKKASTAKGRSNKSEDMLPEYDFDYSKSKPNRFAGRISKERIVVLLDSEVSEVFTTPESVNTLLRIDQDHAGKSQTRKPAQVELLNKVGFEPPKFCN